MRLLFLYSFICLAYQLHAQDIEVKKFEPLEKDQTAALNPRKDINGVTCGLVKVLLKEPGAEFEGSVMGDVQFTGSEYLVYLPNGTKRLGIKHPDYLPTTIVFADYGVKRITSSTTYKLIVKSNKNKKSTNLRKKKFVMFDIKPNKALLFVDGKIIPHDGSGSYAIPLNYGIHHYSVKCDNISINNQILSVNGNTGIITADLTNFYSCLHVAAQTENSDIFINNKMYGKDKWQGMVAPGKYVVETRKRGFMTQAKTIDISESDSVVVCFDKMKPNTGSLRVNYKPDGSEVIVDGKSSGVTPLLISEIPIGEHRVSIIHESYEAKLIFIKVEDGQDLTVEGTLHIDYPEEFKKSLLGK